MRERDEKPEGCVRYTWLSRATLCSHRSIQYGAVIERKVVPESTH